MAGLVSSRAQLSRTSRSPSLPRPVKLTEADVCVRVAPQGVKDAQARIMKLQEENHILRQRLTVVEGGGNDTSDKVSQSGARAGSATLVDFTCP